MSEQDNFSILSNPFQALGDSVFMTILNGIIPGVADNKFVKEAIRPYSSMITLMVISLLIVLVILPASILGVAITGSIGTMESVLYAGLPEELEGYIEEGFEDTGFPRGNPFGGRGYERSTKTAGYMDLNYYGYYGRWHDGLDVVPNNEYYASNQAYKLTSQPVIFATCSGFSVSKIDRFGALYIIIDCRDGQQVWFVHNSVNYIPEEGTNVRAGQPIGVMGNTGNSDGAHVHYVVRVPSQNGMSFVDPEKYL